MGPIAKRALHAALRLAVRKQLNEQGVSHLMHLCTEDAIEIADSGQSVQLAKTAGDHLIIDWIINIIKSPEFKQWVLAIIKLILALAATEEN